MTPEERFERIEATLQRAASLQHQINVRHSGIRGLYKQGVHRIEELADKQEHNASHERTEESVRNLAQTVQHYIESTRK